MGVCQWNPGLPATSINRNTRWNTWTVKRKKCHFDKNRCERTEFDFSHEPFVQTATGVSTHTKKTLASHKEITVMARTGPSSQIGFKLTKATVGGQTTGFCPAHLQGSNCYRQSWASYNKCRKCIMGKWTTCAGSTCHVKKLCFVQGIATVMQN